MVRSLVVSATMYLSTIAILLGLGSGALADITGGCNVNTNVCYANVDNSEQASCNGTPCSNNAQPCTIQVVAPLGYPEKGKATCA
ncbi:hypothetical protein GGR53DRAFT_476794 [Hypoxylon sp. FL1150]|nr:hypothetical protein GGR53DRAFT_476794 [Hypoxylon sp. FL1150]